jgi:hypothetical protein
MISNAQHLLLAQIKNDSFVYAPEVASIDFRKHRVNLIKNYPQLKDYATEEVFDFGKIWPDWIDTLSWGSVKTNMSLEFIAANLKTKTTVMDGTATPEKITDELNKARNDGFPYTHVGFGIYPVGYLQFIDCAKSVKKFDPEIVTIAGNIGSLVEETKNHVDHVFLGDGVKSLRQLFGEDLADPYKVKIAVDRQISSKKFQMTYLATKLGCPEKCDFCMTTKLFGGKITPPLVSPSDVFNAVTELKEKSKKITSITLCEPNMLLFRQWWYELFELFEGYGEPIGIGGPATLASIKKFDFKKISNSSLHFTLFNVGIESFSKEYSKNFEFNKAKEIIDDLRSAGIGTLATFIIGFEHQTRESILEEIELLAKLDCLHYFVLNLIAYPKTGLYDKLQEERKLVDFPQDFYSLPYFQAFEHPHFKIGFDDLLPLWREIYEYLLRETGHQVLNSIEIYGNKPKSFKYFDDRVNECRVVSKHLFESWKRHLKPSDRQIQKYLAKLEGKYY